MKHIILLLSVCAGLVACNSAQVVEPSTPQAPAPVTTAPAPVSNAPIAAAPPPPIQSQPMPVRSNTPDVRSYQATEIASVYALTEHGRPTASGIPYDIYGLTAAHASLPLYAQVLLSRGNQQKMVTITDHLPAGGTTIKLSYQVARDLGMSAGGELRVHGLAVGTANAVSGLTGMSANTAYPVSNAANVFLQAGAFADSRNAQQLQQQLSHQLPYPTIVQAVGQPAQLYRVRIGPLPATAVNQVSAQLQRYGINPMLIRQ